MLQLFKMLSMIQCVRHVVIQSNSRSNGPSESLLEKPLPNWLEVVTLQLLLAHKNQHRLGSQLTVTSMCPDPGLILIFSSGTPTFSLICSANKARSPEIFLIMMTSLVAPAIHFLYTGSWA